MKKKTTQNNPIEEIRIVDGTVEIENKASLKSIFNSYQESAEKQNDFNKVVRRIQRKGFKPLTPIFDKDDTEEVQKFVNQKRSRIAKRNAEYGFTSKGIDDIDLEDELISDPVLANLLNEDREIIVGDSLYKYTETGLYFCKKEDKDRLYNYLEKLSLSEKKNIVQKSKSSTKKVQAQER